MKLILTLSSTNKNKSIMDILAQLATESMEARRQENELPPTRTSGLKKLLIKSAAKTVELIGEDAVNSVFAMLKSTLGRVINENLQQNDIQVAFNVEQIVKDDDRMKVTLKLDSINYKGVINRFLPEILFSLRENDPDNYMWNVYDIVSDDQPKIVKAVMDIISNDKKEEIIALMISQNKAVLCDKISGLLAAQNIEVSIDDIRVLTEPQMKNETVR